MIKWESMIFWILILLIMLSGYAIISNSIIKNIACQNIGYDESSWDDSKGLNACNRIVNGSVETYYYKNVDDLKNMNGGIKYD